MREILSNTIDPDAPLLGLEFYQLRLCEEDNALGTQHCVLQIHAVWKDDFQGAMWESEEIDRSWILDEAKKRYAERRLALVEKGFIYSEIVR
jgi:hypothetical protein